MNSKSGKSPKTAGKAAAPPTTHILLKYGSQKTEILFRAADGVCIGQAKDTVVVFGDEPNRKNSRVFLDHSFAKRWLTGKLARDDMAAKGDPIVEERDAESLIALPADVAGLPGDVFKPRLAN